MKITFNKIHICIYSDVNDFIIFKANYYCNDRIQKHNGEITLSYLENVMNFQLQK